MTDTLLLALLIFLAALLYAAVGQGGASGFLAAMALFNLSPAMMKPTALALSLVVATVGTIRFARAGHFAGNIFWPFALLSIPCAFAGGALNLPLPAYRILLGAILLFAAWWLAFQRPASAGAVAKPVPLLPALGLGAGLGLLSGLTGVGGGIFLSPLLLLLGWADARKAAGVSVAFIWVNSASGLLGHLASVKNIPSEIVWWAPAALAGGWIGAELGSHHLAPVTIRRLLAAVLVVAGGRMLWLR